MTKATAKEVLARALSILETGGWQGGGFGPPTDPKRPHCAVGAIYAAAHALDAPWEATQEAINIIGRMVGPEYFDPKTGDPHASASAQAVVIGWNDTSMIRLASSNRATRVMNTFRKALQSA